MALTQGHFQAYDFNRMVVLFTMMNDKIEVPCAISTDAMDRIEGSTRTTPDRREQQFLRNALRGNFLTSSLRATLRASFCAASIFARRRRDRVTSGLSFLALTRRCRSISPAFQSSKATRDLAQIVSRLAGAAKMSHRPLIISLQVKTKILLTTVAGRSSMVFGGRD